MKTKTLTYIKQLESKYNINTNTIEEATKLLITTYKNNNKLLVCGNGGSACDSEHIVGELMKGFILKREINNELKTKINDEKLSNALQYGLPTISLVSQIGLSTAFSNDQLPEAVFAQQVLGYGKENDVLLCLSTSGNSLNCVYAAKVAKALNMKVITLTGNKNCELEKLSDVTIKAPSDITYEIQEYHLPIYHAMCLAIENEFYGE